MFHQGIVSSGLKSVLFQYSRGTEEEGERISYPVPCPSSFFLAEGARKESGEKLHCNSPPYIPHFLHKR